MSTDLIFIITLSAFASLPVLEPPIYLHTDIVARGLTLHGDTSRVGRKLARGQAMTVTLIGSSNAVRGGCVQSQQSAGCQRARNRECYCASARYNNCTRRADGTHRAGG